MKMSARTLNICAAVLTVAAFASQASAHTGHGGHGSDSASTTLKGQVPTACHVVQSPQPIVIDSTVATGGNIGHATFTNPSAGHMRVTCNVASSTLKVSAEPMTLLNGHVSAASARAGFTDTIDYGVTLSGATAFSGSVQLDAGSAPSADPSNQVPDHQPYGIYASDLSLTVSRLAARDDKAPIAGPYRGVISVTISP